MNRPSYATACGAFLAFGATAAMGSVVISLGTTENVVCSNGVCAPSAPDAVLNVADLEAQLTAGATEVTTTGSGVQADDIIISGDLTWTSTKALTLDAYRSIIIKKSVSVDGGGGLALNTNDGGSGGSLNFVKKGHIFFADLSSGLTINGAGYMLVGDLKSLAGAIANNPAGNYALASGYDASADGTYDESPVSTPFSGNFEGLGHAIRNLSINDPNGEYIGLFTELDGGEIRNVGLTNANVTSTNANDNYSFAVGVLVGYDNGMVTGAYSTGRINSVAGVDGGLVGLVSQTGGIDHAYSRVAISFANGNAALGGGLIGENIGAVTNSYATGSLSNSGTGGTLGGLIGYNGGNVSTSFASGSASSQGGALCGGFVGWNYTNNETIADSYATGSVACSGDDGGFASENSSIIEHCYSTGAGGYGFVVYEQRSASMKHDYWDTTTSGTNEGVGSGRSRGLTGLTSGELQAQLPKGFSPEIWAENSKINGGFPYLIANPPPK